MTEPKFTKGEWLANNVTKNERQVCCPSSVVENFRICRLKGPDRDANSRLIAAAPDLYSALQRLVNVAPEIAPDVQDASVFAEARAALAKARGDSAKTIGGGE